MKVVVAVAEQQLCINLSVMITILGIFAVLLLHVQFDLSAEEDGPFFLIVMPSISMKILSKICMQVK